jgi:hypothetical protein
VSSIDLTTVDAVKAYIGNLDSPKYDDLIQKLITAFSRDLTNWSGQKAFGSVLSFTEIYDGNGSFRMYVKNTPIVAIASIQVNGSTLQPSSGYNSSGYFIEQDQKSIAIRQGATGTGFVTTYPGFGFPYYFAKGIGNIQIQYSAGYNAVPEDLEQAVCQAISIHFMRKNYRDQSSKSFSTGQGTGTTSYRDWKVPPEVQQIFNRYRRNAMV